MPEDNYINHILENCCAEIKDKDIATVIDIKNAIKLTLININNDGDFIVLSNIDN